MQKRTIILMALFLLTNCYLFGSTANSTADYNIVPLPSNIVLIKGGEPFVLNDKTLVEYSENNEMMANNASFLSEYVEDFIGIKILHKISNKADNSSVIKLLINKKLKEDEGYKITISKKEIKIESKTPNGIFYGIQSLRKSISLCSTNNGCINFPAAVIEDSPRFSYRGMMLDVSRHFFPIDVIKEYIDLLALHNMNVFHWHLSDDQGWRIEIKKYPLLTKIGAYRDSTIIGRNSDIYDGQRYGGYYTQEEAREIVEYAKKRYITVIPEIDMPGHMSAALAAYPELGCTGGPYRVEGSWGVFDDILCAGNDKTYDFVKNVLDEIMDIFPSKYIHLGGDEAPKERWIKCPKCQQVIKNQNIKAKGENSAESMLQGYFVSVIEKYINSKGRKIIGWDEILEGNVAQSAVIMSWRGTKGGIDAANVGHDVIMSPTSNMYFDYYQIKETWNEPMCIGGYLPMSQVYNFEPVPDSLAANVKSHIFGVQANLWTEYLPYKSSIEYQILPRMDALCEVQWMNKSSKDYDMFKKRLSKMFAIYDRYNISYCKKEE